MSPSTKLVESRRQKANPKSLGSLSALKFGYVVAITFFFYIFLFIFYLVYLILLIYLLFLSLFIYLFILFWGGGRGGGGGGVICSFTHLRIPSSLPECNQIFPILHRTPP